MRPQESQPFVDAAIQSGIPIAALANDRQYKGVRVAPSMRDRTQGRLARRADLLFALRNNVVRHCGS